MLGPLYFGKMIMKTEGGGGRAFNNFLISNNLEELINEPIHIRDNGSQSCINLICTDQPYVFTEIGVLPSLDPHSKHNIIHGSLSFHNPYPPPHKRKVWDYKTAKIDLIRNDLFNANWKHLFSGSNTAEISLAFTDMLLSIFSRYISNKIITCNEKDASWITPVIKSAICRNSRVYRKWLGMGEHLLITTKSVKPKTQQLNYPFS